MVTIFFFCLIAFYFSYNLIVEFILNKGSTYLYVSDTLAPEKAIAEMAVPRSTGLSRLLGIILCFILCCLFSNKIKNELYILFFAVIISFLIHLLQSRGGYIFLFVITFWYFYLFKESLIKKLFYFLIIFIVPFILMESLISFNGAIKIKPDKDNENRIMTNLKSLDNDLEVKKITSGRIEIWQKVIKIIHDNNLYFGYGPQADRIFMKASRYKVTVLDNNSSNLFLYSYLSAGLIGIICFALIYVSTIRNIYLYAKIKIVGDMVFYRNFSLIITSFLLIRGFFENGFSVYGVDLVFFSICNLIYFFLKHRQIKN